MRCFHHGLDVVLDGFVIATLEFADVDHHVDLCSACGNRLLRLPAFGIGARRAQREPHHRAHLHWTVGKFHRNQRHPIRIDADTGETELTGFRGHSLDIGGRGVGTQQRVVD
jgi:hypothetical protein